ncbi:hypothetical protein L208DRAFT_1374489 [Tricholoma matsutake]|nr:hypothetical protein L208DRAFT_1374489 [Tricholoma matsutake 945]
MDDLELFQQPPLDWMVIINSPDWYSSRDQRKEGVLAELYASIPEQLTQWAFSSALQQEPVKATPCSVHCSSSMKLSAHFYIWVLFQIIIHGPSSVTVNPETEELEAIPIPAMRSSSVFLGLMNAHFIISPDTEFIRIGSKSGINYEADFLTYKQLLINLWSKPGAVKLLALWNGIILDRLTQEQHLDSVLETMKAEFDKLLEAFNDDVGSDVSEDPTPAPITAMTAAPTTSTPPVILAHSPLPAPLAILACSPSPAIVVVHDSQSATAMHVQTAPLMAITSSTASITPSIIDSRPSETVTAITPDIATTSTVPAKGAT